MKRYIKFIASLSFILMTFMALLPIKAYADWKCDGKGWWYEDGNSYYTGWKLIDRNWYYFYPDGYMAANKKIGDYFVNSSGAWTNEITASEAKSLIFNEDGDYLYSILSNDVFFSDTVIESYAPFSDCYNIPRESMYIFYLDNSYGYEGETYLVGKNTKNVYIVANQGGCYLYKIQDNRIIGKYGFFNQPSAEWR